MLLEQPLLLCFGQCDAAFPIEASRAVGLKEEAQGAESAGLVAGGVLCGEVTSSESCSSCKPLPCAW